jgi:hypothetical protein
VGGGGIYSRKERYTGTEKKKRRIKKRRGNKIECCNEKELQKRKS